jgi:hypothetical protein
MKRFIVVLGLISLLAPISAALARGNHRFAIDQQWKRVEAFQKGQNERWKGLEREADRAVMSLKSHSGSNAKPRVVNPDCE